MNLILYEIEFNGTISLQTSIRNYLYKGIDCIKTLLIRFQPSVPSIFPILWWWSKLWSKLKPGAGDGGGAQINLWNQKKIVI